MKIEKIQVLRGPNIWSIRRPNLIQMRLDLEEVEDLPTNKIDGFRERLQKLIPSLITHRCSEGVEGGYVITSGHFTPDAVDFAQGIAMQLINGRQLMALLADELEL